MGEVCFRTVKPGHWVFLWVWMAVPCCNHLLLLLQLAVQLLDNSTSTATANSTFFLCIFLLSSSLWSPCSFECMVYSFYISLRNLNFLITQYFQHCILQGTREHHFPQPASLLQMGNAEGMHCEGERNLPP